MLNKVETKPEHEIITTLNSLARRGSFGFLSGLALMVLGVIGILLVLFAALVVTFKPGANYQLMLVLTVIGFFLTVFAGALYLIKKTRENVLLNKLLDDNRRITVAMIKKLNSKATSAKDLHAVLGSYFDHLAIILGIHS